MTEPPVLIISDHSDAHVPMVGRHLEQMSVPFLRFNTSDFPIRTQLLIESTNTLHRTTLHLAGEPAVDCSDIRSIWYRKPEPYRLEASIPATQHDFAAAECREAVRGVYNSLRSRLWIDDPFTMQISSNKPLQLDLARTVGFEVPRTLITNSPDSAREFFKSCHGRMVYKTLSAPAVQVADDSTGVSQNIAAFTTLISHDSPELWASVVLAPCLFQEYIPKRVEVRATVVGGQILAAEIDSQGDARAVIDWRRGNLTNLKHGIHSLPESIANLCRKLLKSLRLQFGAIDLIITPEGRYVFLEVNPGGQFGWIEYLTDLPISRTIAKLLASGSDKH